MRIGTNHGSLSDRIMNRYGDTPLGMVESALEFTRICIEENFHEIIFSMKASNPQVMVQAYRLLVATMMKDGMDYPLHLGVTEAGEGEDGRIKSAVGIGTLLEDGLGDTIRVSLTEEPEAEIPVAKALVDRYLSNRTDQIPEIDDQSFHPYEYLKRQSLIVKNIGGDEVPRVIIDLSDLKKITPADLKQCGHYQCPLPLSHRAPSRIPSRGPSRIRIPSRGPSRFILFFERGVCFAKPLDHLGPSWAPPSAEPFFWPRGTSIC